MNRMQQYEENQPLPFASYPDDEVELQRPIWVGSNCRRGYGLDYIRKTHQSCCAYCGTDLTGQYDAWLTMVLDHAVPINVCKQLDIISNGWCRSLANAVLACVACNGFCNRYRAVSERRPETFREFRAMRDRIFVDRRRLILGRHKVEQGFYDGRVAGRSTPCS